MSTGALEGATNGGDRPGAPRRPTGAQRSTILHETRPRLEAVEEPSEVREPAAPGGCATCTYASTKSKVVESSPARLAIASSTVPPLAARSTTSCLAFDVRRSRHRCTVRLGIRAGGVAGDVGVVATGGTGCAAARRARRLPRRATTRPGTPARCATWPDSACSRRCSAARDLRRDLRRAAWPPLGVVVSVKDTAAAARAEVGTVAVGIGEKPFVGGDVMHVLGDEGAALGSRSARAGGITRCFVTGGRVCSPLQLAESLRCCLPPREHRVLILSHAAIDSAAAPLLRFPDASVGQSVGNRSTEREAEQREPRRLHHGGGGGLLPGSADGGEG